MADGSSNAARSTNGWKTAAIKLKIGDHVRRIPVSRLLDDDNQASPCLSKLRELALSFYGENNAAMSTVVEEEYQVVFTYLDEEGETIYLSSDVELSEALEFSCSDDDGGGNSGSDEEKPRVQFLRVKAEVTPLSSILEQTFLTRKYTSFSSERLMAPPPIECTENTEETVFRQAVEPHHFTEEVIQNGATATVPPTAILGHQASAKADDESQKKPSEKAKEDGKQAPPRSDANPTVVRFMDKAEEMMQIIRKEVEEVAASAPPLETLRPPPCIRKLQRRFSQAKRDQYQREREHLKHHDPPSGNIGTGVGKQFDPRFVHPRHQCDMCNVLPIRGFRWRAVRPKTLVEGGGKVDETQKVDFVEMNFDLCHRCYVGWREQKDDEAGARAANRFSSMRKMQLSEDVKFHPVQLELDRLYHLRRHQRQEQLRHQGKHVHLDVFLREVANKSSYLAQTCIKTLNLPEHSSRQRGDHINLIHCPEVNEGIIKSLSQLSKKREESAKLAAAAGSPPAFVLDDGNTVVATVVSSLDLGEHAADQCALVEVVVNNNNNNVENSFSTSATSPPPVANVDVSTSRSVVDDPSVMTGDDILPSITWEEATSQEQNVEADDGECFVDSNEEHDDEVLEPVAPELHLSLASSYTLGSSSVTLQQSESTAVAYVTLEQQQQHETSSLSLYLSAIEVVGSTPSANKDSSADVPALDEDKEVVVALEAEIEVAAEEKEEEVTFKDVAIEDDPKATEAVLALEAETEVAANEKEEESSFEDVAMEIDPEPVVSQTEEADADSLFPVEEDGSSGDSVSFAEVGCVGDAVSEKSAEEAWVLEESDGEQASIVDEGDLCESDDDVLSASDEEGEEVVQEGERELCDLSDGASLDDSYASEWDLVDDVEIFARAT